MALLDQQCCKGARCVAVLQIRYLGSAAPRLHRLVVGVDLDLRLDVAGPVWQGESWQGGSQGFEHLEDLFQDGVSTDVPGMVK